MKEASRRLKVCDRGENLLEEGSRDEDSEDPVARLSPASLAEARLLRSLVHSRSKGRLQRQSSGDTDFLEWFYGGNEVRAQQEWLKQWIVKSELEGTKGQGRQRKMVV